jgi:thiazole tautomerase (transcriptional regulator TenI)
VTAAPRQPLICLVTDRHRLHAPSSGAVQALLAQIRVAARAGVDVIQLRERDLSTRALEDVTTRAVAAVSGTACRLVMNDRLDVALACGAAGVHLRHDSFGSDRVRAATGPDMHIGRSVHSVDEAKREAEIGAVDYLIFGTVFQTLSKPGTAGAGLEELARVTAAVPLPVLAIGGITVERLPDVARAGAAGIAAIGLFVPPREDDPSELFAGTVSAVRRAFDRAQLLPGR